MSSYLSLLPRELHTQMLLRLPYETLCEIVKTNTLPHYQTYLSIFSSKSFWRTKLSHDNVSESDVFYLTILWTPKINEILQRKHRSRSMKYYTLFQRIMSSHDVSNTLYSANSIKKALVDGSTDNQILYCRSISKYLSRLERRERFSFKRLARKVLKHKSDILWPEDFALLALPK